MATTKKERGRRDGKVNGRGRRWRSGGGGDGDCTSPAVRAWVRRRRGGVGEKEEEGGDK